MGSLVGVVLLRSSYHVQKTRIHSQWFVIHHHVLLVLGKLGQNFSSSKYFVGEGQEVCEINVKV